MFQAARVLGVSGEFHDLLTFSLCLVEFCVWPEASFEILLCRLTKGSEVEVTFKANGSPVIINQSFFAYYRAFYFHIGRSDWARSRFFDIDTKAVNLFSVLDN